MRTYSVGHVGAPTRWSGGDPGLWTFLPSSLLSSLFPSLLRTFSHYTPPPSPNPLIWGLLLITFFIYFFLSPFPCPFVFFWGHRPIRYVKEFFFLFSYVFHCFCHFLIWIIVDCKVIGCVPVYDVEVIICYRLYLVLLTLHLLVYVMYVYYIFENE